MQRRNVSASGNCEVIFVAADGEEVRIREYADLTSAEEGFKYLVFVLEHEGESGTQVKLMKEGPFLLIMRFSERRKKRHGNDIVKL
jgi:hypothetical protein